ncbi:MAG: precorrin-6y C5,15-methyltransferase (decarboxylating) subunit CbiE [Thermoanaerobacteraceae bacterium]|nr:precorrin-6y C5,15-methyltransferase (decarboxylating) subunit CbiE [Thermoanaerobacteraceae bacterium]
MVYPIKVIGVGPGHEDYLTPAARKAAEQADCLVGGRRALRLFAHLGKETYLIDGNLSWLVEKLVQLWEDNRKVAVLVTGDPGFYSLSAYLKKHFPAEQLEFIPGISSVQVAFARIKRSWQDVRFVSVHGRPLEELREVVHPGQTVVILTDNNHTPRIVAEYLRGKVEGDPRVFICDSLTEPEETVVETRLSRVDQELTNSVMVIAYE